MSPLLDLHAYIAALETAQEVQEIAQEVDLDLEVGAIIRRCYETGGPALLFRHICGVAPGFRILGAPAGISRQPGQRLARIALSLATRCHPTLGSLFFNQENTSLLVTFLRTSEKVSGSTAKVVYNCLQPDEWGDKLPARSSFHHCYPEEIVQCVLDN